MIDYFLGRRRFIVLCRPSSWMAAGWLSLSCCLHLSVTHGGHDGQVEERIFFLARTTSTRCSMNVYYSTTTTAIGASRRGGWAAPKNNTLVLRDQNE
jgi:hypothetical protein